MEEFTRQQLDELLNANGEDGPRISIYIPTERAGREQKKNPIRFKNMVQEAEEQLEAAGLRKPEIDALLERARERCESHDFWKHQQDGYAAFIDGEGFREIRVPEPFPELSVVAPRFHVSPLMPLFTDDHRFLVLALSQKAVRLFSGSRHGLCAVQARDLPKSLPDALGHELTEPSLQHASEGPRDAAIFHGHGAGHDDVEPELRKFVSIVDRAITGHFRERHPPLILATVEHLEALYRQHARYPALVDASIPGNHDDASEKDLHERAWKIAQRSIEARHDEAVGRLAAARREDGAALGVEEVVLAAHEGRVETLLLTRGRRAWGAIDAEQRRVEKHAEKSGKSIDLLEHAAVSTWRKDGRVLLLPAEKMPEGVDQAAILRF